MSIYDREYLQETRQGYRTMPIEGFFGGERSRLDDRSQIGDMPKVSDMNTLVEYYNRTGRINWRAFTITFTDILRKTRTEIELSNMVYKGLRAIQPIQGFIMCPDVDENGHYHMHGVIRTQIKNLPLIKRLIERWFGFNKVKAIDNTMYWLAYIRKDKGFQTTKMERNGKEPLEEAIYDTDEWLRLTAFF